MAGTGLFGYRLGSGHGAQRIEGLYEVQRQLSKLGADAKNEMKPAHLASAELVVMNARPMAPVLTGALQQSLRAFARQRAGVVRAGNASVPYAGPIVFGWPARAIKPNPFIYQAADSRRSDIVAIYEKRMDELIAKHWLSTTGAGFPLSLAADALK